MTQRPRVLAVSLLEGLGVANSPGVLETQMRDVLAGVSTEADVRWLAVLPAGSEAAQGPDWVRAVAVRSRRRSGAWREAASLIRREAAAFEADLIHARGYGPTLVSLLSTRRPVIFDARGLMVPERAAYHGRPRWDPITMSWAAAEPFLVRRAAATVGVSESMTRYLLRGRRKGRGVTIPLTVDVARFDEARSRRPDSRRTLGVAPDDFLVVHSGTVLSAGLDHVADAIVRIDEGTPRARFLLLSYDPAALELRSRLPDEVASKVDIRSASYSEMPALLTAADAGLVLRRRWEPAIVNEVLLTTKFPEYLAAGVLPVVSGHCGTLARFVRDEHAGVVVEDPTGPISLRAPGADERSNLVELARERFDLQVVVRRYLELYREIAGGTAA